MLYLKRNIFFLTRLLDLFKATKELHLFSEKCQGFRKLVNFFSFGGPSKGHLKLEYNDANTTNAASMFIFSQKKKTVRASVSNVSPTNVKLKLSLLGYLKRCFLTLPFPSCELILPVTGWEIDVASLDTLRSSSPLFTDLEKKLTLHN